MILSLTCATTTSTLVRSTRHTLRDVALPAGYGGSGWQLLRIPFRRWYEELRPGLMERGSSRPERRCVGTLRRPVIIRAKVRSDRKPRALDEHARHLDSEVLSRARVVPEHATRGEAIAGRRAVQAMSATTPTISPQGGATPRPRHDPSCEPRRRAHHPCRTWQLSSAADSSDESPLPMACGR
jgi:hypothetical protein